MYLKALVRLQESLSKLPSIGKKSAERMAFAMLEMEDEDLNEFADAIKELNAREKSIINNRYIIGKTQMEISEELGISQAQVSRIESNAIKTLKKTLK